MNQFTLTWSISKLDAGKSIKEFLKEQEISKAALTDIKFSGGGIYVNEHEVNVRHLLKEEDFLKLVFPVEVPSSGMKAEDIPLNIVYEDEYLLVINKPHSMNTIPSREHPSGSLANALLGYYEKIQLSAAPHIVTRLDRDTTGLVLVAKHRHIHHLLSEQQKMGRVKRTYVALVHGNLEPASGTIEAPIGRKSESIIEREVRYDGQYACTHYQLLSRFNRLCYVQLQLETGRTHQIRVHMSFLGHPLLGDDLYGGTRLLIQRQALHCKQLSFKHPVTKELVNLEIPLADDMVMCMTNEQKKC